MVTVSLKFLYSNRFPCPVVPVLSGERQPQSVCVFKYNCCFFWKFYFYSHRAQSGIVSFSFVSLKQHSFSCGSPNLSSLAPHALPPIEKHIWGLHWQIQPMLIAPTLVAAFCSAVKFHRLFFRTRATSAFAPLTTKPVISFVRNATANLHLHLNPRHNSGQVEFIWGVE